MKGERTTSEVAKELEIRPDLLRKWKRRKLLKLAPQGVSGQGRSVECMWSEEAFAEAKALSENADRKKFGPRRASVGTPVEGQK